MGSIMLPQNRLQWSRGSEGPAAHVQQKFNPSTLPPPSPARSSSLEDYGVENLYILLFHIFLLEFVRFIHGLKIFGSSSKLF